MSEFLELAETIIKYLSKFQLNDGLLDPDEKCIFKNTYATAFFGLACALFYKITNEKKWLKRAIVAVKSELVFYSEQFKIKGIFRWEFKNYALIKIYSLIKNELPKNLKYELEQAILSWKNLDSFKTNWVMMRALNYALRYSFFKRPQDNLKSKIALFNALIRQTKEGFFWDDITEFSFQYHAYILALLCQYYLFCKDINLKQKVSDAVIRGVEQISFFISPTGDFNYYGRGKGQVFGYASLIYALLMSWKLTNNLKYLYLAKKVFYYLKRFYKREFPIVLSSKKNLGELYYYNNKGDYLAFLIVYLLYAHKLEPNFRKTKRVEVVKYKKVFPSVGLSVQRTGNKFITIDLVAKQVVYSYPKKTHVLLNHFSSWKKDLWSSILILLKAIWLLFILLKHFLEIKKYLYYFKESRLGRKINENKF